MYRVYLDIFILHIFRPSSGAVWRFVLRTKRPGNGKTLTFRVVKLHCSIGGFQWFHRCVREDLNTFLSNIID